jgi:hypothetical protein
VVLTPLAISIITAILFGIETLMTKFTTDIQLPFQLGLLKIVSLGCLGAYLLEIATVFMLPPIVDRYSAFKDKNSESRKEKDKS